MSPGVRESFFKLYDECRNREKGKSVKAILERTRIVDAVTQAAILDRIANRYDDYPDKASISRVISYFTGNKKGNKVQPVSVGMRYKVIVVTADFICDMSKIYGDGSTKDASELIDALFCHLLEELVANLPPEDFR